MSVNDLLEFCQQVPAKVEELRKECHEFLNLNPADQKFMIIRIERIAELFKKIFADGDLKNARILSEPTSEQRKYLEKIELYFSRIAKNSEESETLVKEKHKFVEEYFQPLSGFEELEYPFQRIILMKDFPEFARYYNSLLTFGTRSVSDGKIGIGAHDIKLLMLASKIIR